MEQLPSFYQVVWDNPVEFKDVIIHLGDFHAMQELFAIIGKIMSGSGFLYQADMICARGINGVLCGKHYNHSWSVALSKVSKALHRLFMEKESEVVSFTEELTQLIKNAKSKNSCNLLTHHPELNAFSN